MQKGDITMSTKERARIDILTKVLEGKMKQIEASELLRLSTRHINRIVNNIKKSNDLFYTLAHKNRGKESNKKFSKTFINKILSIYKNKYPDFGPTFATEKLKELDNISISREALRNILKSNNIHYPTRKHNRAICHIFRERKAHFGEMIQLDGSAHHWFEKRLAKEICLLIFIDDATGTIFAKFYEYEGTYPVLDFLMCFIKKYGIPKSIYSDKHSTYLTTRNPSIDELLKAERPKTQFHKVCSNLGIEMIFAHSPQAKGRVERARETLQDRLVKELRLNNISDIPEANIFLEKIFLDKHNEKFSIEPKSNVSLFKPIPNGLDLKWTFVISDIRQINNDFTIHWQNNIYLLLNRHISLKGKKVLIKQALDGELQFSTKDKIIRVQKITEQNLKQTKKNIKLLEKYSKEFAKNNKSKKSYLDKIYINNFKNFYSYSKK